MISAWHLLWIVPLAASVGFVWAAVLAVGKYDESEDNLM